MSVQQDFVKLDDGLSQILQSGVIRPSELVPVVISTDSPESFGVIEKLVEDAGGRVRHVLRRLSALAVWLPLSAVQVLAASDAVTALELDQRVVVATE